MESLGTVQKAKKVPRDVLKKCGQTFQAKNNMMRHYLRGDVRHMGTDDRAVWGETAIKFSI